VRGDPFGGTMVSHVPTLSATPVVNDPTLPPMTNLWTDLPLSEADARAFNARLNALLEEYRGRQGAMRYLVRLGFASLKD
jgi:hypothetical protein